MAFNDLMAKLRHFDNKAAKWIMRHFYIIFFEFLLVFVFFGFFVNTLKIIDVSHDIDPNNVVERLLLVQSQNTLFLLFLILLNSFWLLYIFNNTIRFRVLLKEINFNLNRRK